MIPQAHTLQGRDAEALIAVEGHTSSDGDAFLAVKAKGRLGGAIGVEPSPSVNSRGGAHAELRDHIAHLKRRSDLWMTAYAVALGLCMVAVMAIVLGGMG